MDLDTIRQERSKWMTWKNIAPLRLAIESLPNINTILIQGDTLTVRSEVVVDVVELEKTARLISSGRS